MKRLIPTLFLLFLLLSTRHAGAADGHDHAQTVVVNVRTLDEAVNTVAYFQREIDSLLDKGELAKIHTAAFAARDAATSSAAFASSLPEQARRELASRIARIGEIVVQLDKYGDAGKAAETSVFARKLQEESTGLQLLTAVTVRLDFKPDIVVQATGGGHASSRCPHKARHGGRFSMALSDLYHLEGVYPAPGEFRLYFYDAESCEIPPAGIRGRLLFRDTELQLEPSADGSHLRAALAGQPEAPVSLTAILDLPNPQTGVVVTEHFSYNFYRLSKSPVTSSDQMTTATSPSQFH